MAWSSDPREGFLTKEALLDFQSKLTNEIFRGELQELYVEKDVRYKELTAAVREAMSELVRRLDGAAAVAPGIEQKLSALARSLETVKGKKLYGYLKKPVKAQVDEIVAALSEVPEVAACYERWNRLKDELDGYYRERPRERLPLAEQKEFRAIKNMVIREAENLRLGAVTFEDERMVEPDADGVPETDPLDMDEREAALRRAAEAGSDRSQYALGRLLEERERPAEALAWLERAAACGNPYVQYRLANLKNKRWKVTALVDTDDIHALMTAASGAGKTAYFLYPNIEYALASGMSFLCTDTKGDLFRNYAGIAKDCYGYRISVLDLRNPTRSDGNNLLNLINKYMDVYKADRSNLAAKAKAEKYAKILSETLIKQGGKGADMGQSQFFVRP